MHAIRVEAIGDADALKWATVDAKEPGPGEARVHVRAVGVNFIDVYQRRGWYQRPLPYTPGSEGAGVVEAVGEGVTLVAPGDRVAWSGAPGSYAETLVAPAAALVKLPDGLDFELAAASMLQGMTAHYLVHDAFPLRKESTCIVHAAAGGVGLILCQMAKRIGARVIGTVSTEEKAALARAAGATEIVFYTREDFVAAARRITEGRGVDVIYDSVGLTTFLPGLDALRQRGTMVLYGQSSGQVAPIDPQVLSAKGSLFLTRPTLAHYTATRADLEARAGAVLGAIGRGEIKIRVGARYPLEQAAEAHRALEGRGTTGKVLLTVG